MQHKENIFIIGAGISGLIAAYELERAGFKPVVIEQTDDVGGRVKTINHNGYRLDVGFQVLLSAYPLVKKYIDISKLDVIKLSSGALIYNNGKKYLIGDPVKNWKVLIPTLLSNVGTFGDKLKIFKLSQTLKKKSLAQIFNSPEQSTQDYLIDYGFSKKVIERFFKPFFAGIFLEPELNTSNRMFQFVYKMFAEGYATIPKLGMGEISAQLRSNLNQTKFLFNTEVQEVSNEYITTRSGERHKHKGVIITGNANAILPGLKKPQAKWKSCMCFYFDVDQINIPNKTIALIADTGKYANNLYAFQDDTTGKTILSVTTLRHNQMAKRDLIDTITREVKAYTGCKRANYIQHYRITQALPEIQAPIMTINPSKCEVKENIFLAGDYLLNGSLNAAMESGLMAANGLIDKNTINSKPI